MIRGAGLDNASEFTKKRLRELWERSGLSQAAAARACGMAQPQFARAVDPEGAVPTLDVLERIVLSFGSTLGEFFSSGQAPKPRVERPTISEDMRTEILKIAQTAAEHALLNRDQVVLKRIHESFDPSPTADSTEPADPLLEKLAVVISLPDSRQAVDEFLREELIHRLDPVDSTLLRDLLRVFWSLNQAQRGFVLDSARALKAGSIGKRASTGLKKSK